MYWSKDINFILVADHTFRLKNLAFDNTVGDRHNSYMFNCNQWKKNKKTCWWKEKKERACYVTGSVIYSKLIQPKKLKFFLITQTT